MAQKFSLARNSAIIFSGNMIVNISNYLFTIFMARFLGLELFAALTALLATLTLIGIPFQAILLGFTKFGADLEQSPGKLKYLWLSGTKIIGILGIFLALLAIIATNSISNFLNLNEPIPYILLMLSIPIGLLTAINRGVIQGLQNFVGLSISMSIEGISKIILGLLFVLAGFKLSGATGAILGASVISLLATLPILKSLINVPTKIFQRRSLLKLSLFTLLVTIVVTVFLNLDVILAKAFLPGEIAGRYAAASTIAKIIPYLLSAIVGGMLPRIAQLVANQQRHISVLIEAIGLTAIASLIIYSIYLLVPKFVLNLFYGSLYLDAEPLLAILGGAMFCFTLANVFLMYFLSIKNNQAIWALIISLIGLGLLFNFYHNSAEELARALLSGSLLLLFLVSGTFLWIRRSSIIQLFQTRSF